MNKVKILNITSGILNIIIGVSIVLPSVLSIINIYQNKTTNSVAVAFAMIVVLAVMIILGIVAGLLFLLYLFFGVRFLQFSKLNDINYKKLKTYLIINYILDGIALVTLIGITTMWLWVIAIDILVLINLIVRIINHKTIIQNVRLNDATIKTDKKTTY